MNTTKILGSIEFLRDGKMTEGGDILDKFFRFRYADGTEEVKPIANKNWHYIERLGQKCPVEVLWTYRLNV